MSESERSISASRGWDDDDRARYAALTSLWVHHNSVQLQVPTIVVATGLVVLSILLGDEPEMLKRLVSPEWARALTGVPLLVAGCLLGAMVYSMARARLILASTESAIDELERVAEIDEQSRFVRLNRQQGLSATSLLRLALAVLAGGLAMLGLLVVLSGLQ